MHHHPTPTPTATGIDARVLDAARDRAQALRQDAIDHALRQLGRWLARPFAAAPPKLEQELPCHS